MTKNLWLRFFVFIFYMYGQSYNLKNQHQKKRFIRKGTHYLMVLLLCILAVGERIFLFAKELMYFAEFFRLDLQLLKNRDYPDKAVAILLRNNSPGSQWWICPWVQIDSKFY